MKLQDKFALVTGGGTGIGRAISMRLAAQGAMVFVNYSKSEAKAADTVAQIKAAGGKARAVRADIGRLDDIRTMFEVIQAETDVLDVLVNNAAYGVGAPTLATTSPDEFERTFAVNARGTFFVTQAAARIMRDGGRIVSISSSVTHLKVASYVPYNGSKAAVEAFTRSWAAELGPRRITVNSVSPGATNTEMLWSTTSPETVAAIAEMTLLKRVGEPEDVADVVAFLVSDEGRWVTGQSIIATGGL